MLHVLSSSQAQLNAGFDEMIKTCFPFDQELTFFVSKIMNEKNQNNILKMKNFVRTWPFGLFNFDVPLENSDLFADRFGFGTRSGVFNGDSHGVSFNSLRIFHSISSCKATSSISKHPRSCSIRPGAVGLRIYDGCEQNFESIQIQKRENLHASSVPFVIEDQNDQ